MKLRERLKAAVEVLVGTTPRTEIEQLVRRNGSWFPGDTPGDLRVSPGWNRFAGDDSWRRYHDAQHTDGGHGFGEHMDSDRR